LNGLRQKIKENDTILKKCNENKEAAAAQKEKLDLMITEHRERLQEIQTLKQALAKSQEDKAGCIREKESLRQRSP